MIVMAVFVAEARGRVSAFSQRFASSCSPNADFVPGEHTRWQLDRWIDTWSCVHIIRRRHGDD